MTKASRITPQEQEVPESQSIETYYDVFLTEIGWFIVVASNKGLKYARLRWSPQDAIESLGNHLNASVANPRQLAETREAIQAYLAGEAPSLNHLVLDVDNAPPFYKAAWAACRSIPEGQTRSYGWLAAQAGSPMAFRAAGQAMANNRIHFIIPCHRVVGSSGVIRGHGGHVGFQVRKLLLRREAFLQNPPGFVS